MTGLWRAVNKGICSAVTLLPIVLLSLPLSGIAPVSAEEPQVGSMGLQPLMEYFGDGRIDWQNGYYYAEVVAPIPERYRGKPVNPAMGKILAERAAGAMADSVFLQLVANTRVDARSRLADLAENRAELRLLGNIRNREKLTSRLITQDARPSLQVRYRVPIRGVDGVVAKLYDRIVLEPIPQPPLPASGADPMETIYIDARGTGLRPALFPRILDPDGNLLYDAAVAGKEQSIREGVARYVTVENGSKVYHQPSRRAPVFTVAAHYYGERILPVGERSSRRKKRKLVRAGGASGLQNANIIISRKDAERMQRQSDNGQWPRGSRITVITDSAIGGTEGRAPQPLRYAGYSGH